MAGFDDIVQEAMPYMAKEYVSATAGASWDLPYEVRDAAGALVPWTGCTVTAAMYPTKKGSTTPTLTFTASLPTAGVVRVTATSAQTEVIAAGRYFHEVEVTDGSGRKVKLVGAGDSFILVKDEVAP